MQKKNVEYQEVSPEMVETDITDLVPSKKELPQRLLAPQFPEHHIYNQLNFPCSKYGQKKDRVTPAQIRSIIEAIADSPRDQENKNRLLSIKELCQTHKITPSAMYDKINSFPEVRDHYTHAQIIRAEIMADSLLAEAEDDTKDILESDNAHGVTKTGNMAKVRRSELIIKARTMVLGHMNKEKYNPDPTIRTQNLHVHATVDREALKLDNLGSISLDDMVLRHKQARQQG